MSKLNLFVNVIFALLLFLVRAKDLIVDSDPLNSNETTYPTLDQAIRALYSGSFLIEEANTITLLPNCVDVVQYFPNTPLTGTSSQKGSISISFQSAAATIQGITLCDQIPAIQISGDSYLQVWNLASLSINGVRLKYSKANYENTLSNISSVTFSSFCFENSESSQQLEEVDVFSISNVTSFTMTKGLYSYDGLKMLSITQCEQVVIDELAFFAFSWISPNFTAAFNISNNNTALTTSVLVNNFRFTSLSSSAIPMPELIWISNINSVSISSFSASSVNFNFPGAAFTRSLIAVVRASSLSIDNFQLTGIETGQEIMTLNHQYIYISAVKTVTLSNFTLQENTWGTFDNDKSSLVYISDGVNGTTQHYPMNITVSQWQMISCNLTKNFPVLAMNFVNDESYGEMNLLGVSVFGSSISMESAFMKSEFLGSKTVSTSRAAKYIIMSEILLNQAIIPNATFIKIEYLSGPFIACAETIHCELSNSSFNGNFLQSSQVFKLKAVLMSVSMVNFTNNELMATSSFIKNEGAAPTILVSDVIVKSIRLDKRSNFIAMRYLVASVSSIESCFNAGGGRYYAETAPYIVYRSSFDNITIQGISELLNAGNHMVVVQECNFTNITITEGDSTVITIGGESYFFATYTQNPTLSVFLQAESKIFAKYPTFKTLFGDARNSILNTNPSNGLLFISVRDCYFADIMATGNVSLLLIPAFDFSNSTVRIENNYFTKIYPSFFAADIYLISTGKVRSTSLLRNTATGIDSSGYFFNTKGEEIKSLEISANSMFQSSMMSFLSITATSCIEITLDQNNIFDVETKRALITASCSSFNSTMTFSNCNFYNISVKNHPLYMAPASLITFVALLPTAQDPAIQFSNNNLSNISVINYESRSVGVYPVSLIFFVAMESMTTFFNNTFSNILIIPRGNFMTISANRIIYSQSSFSQIRFGSGNGAVYANTYGVVISDCSFVENSCIDYDCSGLFKLLNPNNILDLRIKNTSFERNMAPHDTILSVTNSQIQIDIDSLRLVNNDLYVERGLISLVSLSNSKISIKNLTVIQDRICCEAYWRVFHLEDSGNSVYLTIADANVLVNGNTAGSLVSSFEGSPVEFHVSNLNFLNTTKSPADITSHGIPLSSLRESAPHFGIFESDNFNATFDNLNIQNVASNAVGLIILDCDTPTDQLKSIWHLKIQNSKLENLNLTQPIILIRSNLVGETALNNLTVILDNTTFTNVTSLSTIGTIIRSTTSLIGNQDPNQFSILIANCSFTNVSGINGLIYGGIESKYRSIIWIRDTVFESLTATGTGGILHGSFNSSTLASYQSIFSYLEALRAKLDNIANGTQPQHAPNYISYKMTTSVINNAQSKSGSVVFWESTTEAISVLLSENTFRNISSSSNGGLIYASYYPEATAFLALSNTSAATFQIALNANKMEFITSNQSGGVAYISSGFTKINNQQINQSRILESSTSPQIGNITILNSELTSISALKDGGVLYENSLNNTLTVNVTSNTFQNISAQARGGVFFFNQPMITIINNSFTEYSADIAGGLLYSVSNQIDTTDFVAGNNLSNQSESSVISYSSTNLKVEMSIPNETALSPETLSGVSNPIFPNFTSLALQKYQINFTLVYQQPGTNQEQIVVADKNLPNNSNITLRFISPRDQSVQSVVSTNCSTSVCHVLPTSITLKGNANDLILVNATYMSEDFTQFQQFSLRLRACVPGEINNTAECQYCTAGTYSVNPSDKICQSCPVGATCNGGTHVTISKGYYRSTSEPNSLRLVPCNDTDIERCLEGDAGSGIGNCKEPFAGPVCLQCDTKKGFLSSGKANSCSECHSGPKLVVYPLTAFVVSIAYQILMVVITYKENKKISQNMAELPPDSLVREAREIKPGMFMVILTTFLQLSSIVAGFDTGNLSNLFNITDIAVNPSNQLAFLMQCLFLSKEAESLQRLKFQILWYLFSPFVKILIVVSIEIIVNACTTKNITPQQQMRKRKDSLARIGAFAAVLILLEQPGTIGMLFKYLQCVQLDPYIEETYIIAYNDISCNTESYSIFLKAMVIPGLVFCGLIIPFTILAILFKKRKTLYNLRSLSITMGIFFNSYNKDAYYWGVLAMITKILIYIASAVIDSSMKVKIIIYLLILNVYSSLLNYKKPFINYNLGLADRYCYISCMMIMMLFLLQKSITDENLQLVCGIFIVICFTCASVNVLRHILWWQIKVINSMIQSRKDILKTKKILKETLASVKSCHKANPHHRDRYGRRAAFRVELPMK